MKSVLNPLIPSNFRFHYDETANETFEKRLLSENPLSDLPRKFPLSRGPPKRAKKERTFFEKPEMEKIHLYLVGPNIFVDLGRRSRYFGRCMYKGIVGAFHACK